MSLAVPNLFIYLGIMALNSKDSKQFTLQNNPNFVKDFPKDNYNVQLI